MIRLTEALTFVALVVVAIGCNSEGTGNGAAPATSQASSDGHDHTGHEHADHDHSPAAMAKVKEALAKLSPEDAAAAEKQHICPVSNAMLGSMGAPQKVDVQGTPVWICCEGCREELLANSEKYVAKLKSGTTP